MHQSESSPASPEMLEDFQNFSLVLGGPLYQLFRKAHLGDDVESDLKGRILIITAIIWLPLLALCAIEGTLISGIEVPFLTDVETHARFLISVPLLIVAELVVHRRVRGIIPQFFERKLVPDAAVPEFRRALHNAIAWRNSIPAELFLVVLVFTLGYYIRTEFFALSSSTWYARVGPEGTKLTMAGHWFYWVSTPILQFLLLRWLLRIVIWARFLWQVSRIKLDLNPTHPDRNAGLGFLGGSAHAYAPLLAAFGAGVAGLVASRIFHEGASLADFRLEILALVILNMLLVLGPISVFAMQILEAKREALRIYGAFAAEYTRDFHRRWILSPDHDSEPLLGTGDIQSLADLGNAYSVIKEIRAVPFNRDTLVQVTAATVIPFLPLIPTMIPLDELLKRIFGSVL